LINSGEDSLYRKQEKRNKPEQKKMRTNVIRRSVQGGNTRPKEKPNVNLKGGKTAGLTGSEPPKAQKRDRGTGHKGCAKGQT